MNKPNWLSENIRAVIAVLMVVAVLGTFIIMINKGVKSNDTTTSIILGILGTQLSMIFGYYYGASKNTSDAAKVESEKLKTTVEVAKNSPIPNKVEEIVKQVESGKS